MTQTPFQPPAGYEPDDLFTRKIKARKRKRVEHPVFAALPLRKRRGLAVAMGWKIRSYPDGAGQFLTHDYIPGDRKWPADASNALACQWADIFFVGTDYRRRGVFYNTTIETLAHYLAGKIEREADDMLQSRMGSNDLDDNRVYSKQGSLGLSMIFAPRKPIDAFGGMTQDGKLAELIDDLSTSMESREDIQAFACLDPGYQYGIGLRMVVPDAGLTVEGIARWVERYRQEGEGKVKWACEDREALIAQVRSLLARKAWAFRRMQAADLNLEPPAEPVDPIGKVLAAAASNAIKM